MTTCTNYIVSLVTGVIEVHCVSFQPQQGQLAQGRQGGTTFTVSKVVILLLIHARATK